jgi:hypothetical protein
MMMMAATITIPTTSNGVFLEKLVVAQLVKKYFVFYETRTFITVFTTAHPWILP